MPGQQRARGSSVYDKPPMPIEDLVLRLASRGLVIPDRARATRYVRHIGYFRLSPYTIPFRENPTEDGFRQATAFDEVLDLYVFDRTLRLLVLDALERVEVAVRAALTDHMSTKYDNPHWYVELSHFRDSQKHAKFLADVSKTCEIQLRRSPEEEDDALLHRSALEHYLLTYGTPHLPPSWLMVETLTLGQLCTVYGNLAERQDKTAIAADLGLNAPVLESWLKTYVRVRNICAHHGRLWNVGLGVYPAIPTSRSVSWLRGADRALPHSRKRLYPVLVSLQSVLDTISPRSGWAERLYQLLSTRPEMNLSGMGVPRDWFRDDFWSPHLARTDTKARLDSLRRRAARPRLSTREVRRVRRWTERNLRG